MIEHARGVVTSGIASSSVCVCVCVCVCYLFNSDTMNERTNSTSDANDASTSRERLQESFKMRASARAVSVVKQFTHSLLSSIVVGSADFTMATNRNMCESKCSINHLYIANVM